MTLKELAVNLPAIKDEAKHLFGVEPLHDIGDGEHQNENWQYYLINMIYSNNPEAYLREHTSLVKENE